MDGKDLGAFGFSDVADFFGDNALIVPADTDLNRNRSFRDGSLWQSVPMKQAM